MAKRRWCSEAGKVTKGLAESNGSYNLVGYEWLSDLPDDCIESIGSTLALRLASTIAE